ncbi:helix-turn-helix domain-containing protein [Paraflavitalea pollutisoli]|uniref:helix-turn-helix domain-containing protein n=1 Tax=Paraflavitalea pollutisoli TaxID=3034143 RepID=UPI0023EDF8D0|nr:helix-turn-helix transcriptional regulator [Paraflavitalea sp. H1-2-19X]
MSFPEKLTLELMRFGQRIHQLRKHRGFTLQGIEREIGISNSTLSKIENGMVNVEFQTIVKIAGVLKVELVELFNYDGQLPEEN